MEITLDYIGNTGLIGAGYRREYELDPAALSAIGDKVVDLLEKLSKAGAVRNVKIVREYAPAQTHTTTNIPTWVWFVVGAIVLFLLFR